MIARHLAIVLVAGGCLGPRAPTPRPPASPPATPADDRPTPEELGAVPNVGSCRAFASDAPPTPICGSAPLFSTTDEWKRDHDPGASFEWVPYERVLVFPEEELAHVTSLLSDSAFFRLHRKDATGPQPYLLRAVYPDLPEAPGCRHNYRVRLDPGGVVTVVNPTLSRQGQCAVPMRKSAVVAYLDAEPKAVFSTAATLRQ